MGGIRYWMNEKIEIKRCENRIHAYKSHFHNEISIGLVETGASTSKIDNKSYEIVSNTILIIPAKMVHKCTPHDSKKWSFKMIYINEHLFETAFNKKSKDLKFSSLKLNKAVFKNIIKFIDKAKDYSMDIENESMFLKYIYPVINVQNANILENFNLKRVKECIDDNYLSNITLDELAKINSVSKYSLIRQFEKQYGLSPHKYIMNLRINYAKKIIKANEDFAYVAIKSGFYDQSHFIKYFKEYTGVTPMEYRS